MEVEREDNRAKDMSPLPEVPRATLVGMRTYIRGHSTEAERSETLVEEQDPWPLPGIAPALSFEADGHVSLETEMVRS